MASQNRLQLVNGLFMAMYAKKQSGPEYDSFTIKRTLVEQIGCRQEELEQRKSLAECCPEKPTANDMVVNAASVGGFGGLGCTVFGVCCGATLNVLIPVAAIGILVGAGIGLCDCFEKSADPGDVNFITDDLRKLAELEAEIEASDYEGSQVLGYVTEEELMLVMGETSPQRAQACFAYCLERNAALAAGAAQNAMPPCNTSECKL